MTISHFSTQEYLNTKEAQGKYGGNSLETMVSTSLKSHLHELQYVILLMKPTIFHVNKQLVRLSKSEILIPK